MWSICKYNKDFSKESLDPYLSSSSSLSTSLAMIKRLHLVVEIAFACQTYISLPSASLKTLVHTALARLKDEDSVPLGDKMVMEFPLQAADVKVGIFSHPLNIFFCSFHFFRLFVRFFIL